MNIIIDRSGHFVSELAIEFTDIASTLATDKLDDLLVRSVFALHLMAFQTVAF